MVRLSDDKNGKIEDFGVGVELEKVRSWELNSYLAAS